jgi:hypothetical protein
MPANSNSTTVVNTEEQVVKAKHPLEQLKDLATQWKLDIYSEEFAQELDKRNLWPTNRDNFFYPKVKDIPNSNS